MIPRWVAPLSFILPLTDWNIPHRGLASFPQDSCLSLSFFLYLLGDKYFKNCSMFIDKGLGACGHSIGHIYRLPFLRICEASSFTL